jgi:hypothetical protein
MNPRARGRVTACAPAEARGRREQARAFLDVADLVLVEPSARPETHVADSVHYSPRLVSTADAQALVRQARALVEAAERL